ncbi:MAG TPA: ABC transporter ATP-binding protein, partial [Bacilli bacterium]
MRHLKWITGLMKEYKWSYVLVLLFLILEGISYLGIIGLQKWIIDDVFVGNQYGILMPIILLFAAIFLCYSVFFTITPYTFFKNVTRLNYKLCHILMTYLQQMPIKNLQNERTAKYVHYFTNDAANAARMIGFDLPRIVQQLIMIIVLMTVIGFASLHMLIFMTILCSSYVFIGTYFSNKLRIISKEVQEKKSDMLIHLEEGISSTREVISYHRGDWESARYHQLFSRFFKKVMHEGKLVNKQIFSTEPIKWGAALLVLGYGGYELMRGNMTLGMFVIVYQYSFLMMETVYHIFQLSMTVASHTAYLDRIKEVIDG